MGHAEILQSFRLQAEQAGPIGSPLYGELLARCVRDLDEGGPLLPLVEDYPGHPVLDALPLRLLGAVHALVLSGEAPELARFYPSAGGRFDTEPAWRAFRALLDARADAIRSRLSEPVQTNEVRRCAPLLGGFLRVARATGLPLRLLEIGSSAGLNLLFDRWRYELGPHRFGDPRSRLVLAAEWSGPPPDLGAPLRVTSREGCDPRPIDLRDPAQRLRLLSFVWPDQAERLAALHAAIDVALEAPPRLVAMGAGDFLAGKLAAPVSGVATLIFQSVVWLYIPEDERRRVTATVEAAGDRASQQRPLAWLRLEGIARHEAELRLRIWPDGEDRLLARAHYHGSRVTWLDAD
jgi:hypothetical protein